MMLPASDFPRFHRRDFLRRASLGLGGLALAPVRSGASTPPVPVFAQRGYYITFMRMPTYGLAQWKHTIDLIHADGGNLLLLWVAGAFRSRKFPVTWRYNATHENVRRDLVADLIAHAHRRSLRVLLGFTPFGYDGVNQYPLEHPELKAVKKDGGPAGLAGIGCWGWNLCPSQPAAQRFMLEYVREMFFEFYPQADGLMIESSDYAICYCPDCQGRFFDREFEFVRTISEEVWARQPGATLAIYPHYFSGAKVPGFDAMAARQPFDSRWTLFFTPHSAHLDPRLIREAKSSLWWDEAPALHNPAAIQRGAQRAAQAGVTGYVPSLEAYSFIPTHAEEGQDYLVGRRQVPLGFGWLPADRMPFDELPIRVNRIAYREFTREPNLPFDEFKRRLGREIFGRSATEQAVDDLLLVQSCFTRERTWCQPSPVVYPERVRALSLRGELKEKQRADYRQELELLRQMSPRLGGRRDPGSSELRRIVDWILQQWAGANEALLQG